ncbi:phage shock protein C (PspC) family protein [Streptomyces radiopugnans]|uniref:Phage shock protein C (PspC) family protein n=2 Tax=Streptomyces radiopugnans TaxID=403935 RepID=A0A1H9HTE4_9ACTN|nr:phage shock protein C (PspC) family protein [Streptomyces radiopugnans]
MSGSGRHATMVPMKDAQPPAGEPQPDAPDAPEAGARLTRSRRHKVVAGVCGGLGRHYELDPVIFRVPLAVLSVVGGLGLLFYGFAWLLVPLEGEDENEGRRLLSGRVEGTTLSAVLCALVGSGLFLNSLGSGDGGTQTFSVLLAGSVAGAAYWSRHRRRAAAAEEQGGPADPVTAHAVADAPPEAQAPPAPAGPSWWREPLTKDGPPQTPRDTGYLWGPEDEPSVGPYASAPPYAEEAPGGDGDGGGPERSGTPRGRRPIGGPVFLLALAAAVIGAAAVWHTQPLGVALSVGLGSALGVFVLGALVSVFYGRIGGGTFFAIMCTGLLLAGSMLLPRDITTDWADRAWSPASAAAVEERYELGTGSALLDLSEASPGEGRTLSTVLDLGAGEARITVPHDVEVELTVDVGVGGYRLAGLPGDGGWGSAQGGGIGIAERRTLPPAEDGGPGGTLRLTVRVGVGEVVIVQHGPDGAAGEGDGSKGPEEPGKGTVQEPTGSAGGEAARARPPAGRQPDGLRNEPRTVYSPSAAAAVAV